MWLRLLEADRLRNLKALALQFDAGLTVITGRNGQGKTSLLEAVYLLGTAHSFRTRRGEEMVGWGGGPLRVHGRVSGLRGETALSVVVDQGQRRLSVDGGASDLDRYLGRLDLVALSGDGMRVLRDGPDGRRRFIDRGIVGLRPSFIRDLSEYRRTLAERNALVRRGHVGRPTATTVELDAWEERLAVAAATVHRSRREYLVRLASRLGPAERALFPDGDELRIRYRPSPSRLSNEETSDSVSVYKESLAASRRRDMALGFTAEGPHRDELEVSLDATDLRKFGSAGQLRAAMVALSAGQLDLLREDRGEAPLFLLDDFDSDLDEIRVESLVNFLREGGFQALLATSKDGFVERLGRPTSRIRMDGGVARVL